MNIWITSFVKDLTTSDWICDKNHSWLSLYVTRDINFTSLVIPLVTNNTICLGDQRVQPTPIHPKDLSVNLSCSSKNIIYPRKVNSTLPLVQMVRSSCCQKKVSLPKYAIKNPNETGVFFVIFFYSMRNIIQARRSFWGVI